ncbi:MAG TPA: ABC transporter permease [Vicinamibacterales bacterium]|nr:ABC transporter permease [Vicinamibacterales bacterium]
MRACTTALHRLAIHAYPAPFRRDFGPELNAIFDQRQAAATSGLHAAGLGMFQVADAVVTGLSERARVAVIQWAWPGRVAPSACFRSLAMSFEWLGADVRLALRQFRRTPLFALVTAATLALGIGANSAIFGVVYSVLWRPLPYADPNSLVMIWSDNTRQSEPHNPVSPANVDAFRAAPSLGATEAMYSFLIPVQIRLGSEPEVIQGSAVTPGMLDLLGRVPMLGRMFQTGDTSPGIVLSHDFWQRRFNRDPNVVGQTIEIVGAPQRATILGVMPEDFVFPYRSMLGPTGFTRVQHADIWLPLTRAFDARLVDPSGQPNRNLHYLSVVARLKSGMSIERATADLSAIASDRAARFPDTNNCWEVTVRPLHEQTVGQLRPALLTLLGGVAVVLMITCLNVANVMLARATGRRRDLAVRSALGASRGRLIQQTLVESLLLSLAGGVLGLGLMAAGTQAILAMAPAHLPRLAEVSASVPVVVFALLLALATGIIVGLLPALSAARSQAQESLRETQRSTASPARQRVRSTFVIAEVALAMTLTIGAGLLLRSFVSVLGVHAGFEADRLLTLQMAVPSRLTDPASRLGFYDTLEARLRAVPGVTRVGGTTRLPLGSTSVTTYIEVEGRNTPAAERPEVEFRRAVFDYFGTMGIPLLRGRLFGPEDVVGGPSVAVANTVFASRVFPGEDAVGKRIRLGGSTGPWTEIVGVVGSIKHRNLEETPRPELYVSYRQNPPVSPFIAIKTAGDPATLAPGVRQAIREAGADPPTDVRTMEQIRSSSVGERRFVLLLVGLFGGVTLVLAGLGVYGVITLIAAERTTEVGIRLALGASPMQVLSLVIGQAVRLAMIGITLGAIAALALAPLFAWQLFGIGATDPLTYITVALALALTAACAALVPARRAMRIDPATTLRA